MSDYKEGDMRVWWIPQIPMKPFLVRVDSLIEAKNLLEVLGRYDLFQLENNIKPDFSNAGGLEIFTEGDWCEFENVDGKNIHTVNLDYQRESAVNRS
jgi:hypothetical protein